MSAGDLKTKQSRRLKRAEAFRFMKWLEAHKPSLLDHSTPHSLIAEQASQQLNIPINAWMVGDYARQYLGIIRRGHNGTSRQETPLAGLRVIAAAVQDIQRELELKGEHVDAIYRLLKS